MKDRFYRVPKLCYLAVILLSLSVFVPILMPTPASAAISGYYYIEASIDGVSDLIIKGNTVQWHNISNWAPGQAPWEDPKDPTKIGVNTTDPSSLFGWYPAWPDGNEGEKWSSTYSGLIPGLPQTPQLFTLTVLQARAQGTEDGGISISQLPSIENGYELIVRFNDGPVGAGDWYKVQVNYAPVPLPAAVLLLGSGLIGLAGFRKKPRNR